MCAGSRQFNCQRAEQWGTRTEAIDDCERVAASRLHHGTPNKRHREQ
jgi:hypothetical protein